MRIVAARLVTARLVVVRIVVVRLVTDRIAAEKEVQTRKVPLARNSLRLREIQVHTKWGKGYTRDIIKGGAGVAPGLPYPLCEWLSEWVGERL